jgi:hypothetical protein
MEAMMLQAAERDELSHRLAQRTAALMSAFGRPTMQVYGDMHRAYGIRSTYIHGGHVEQQADLSKLRRAVLEYCRQTLVVLLWLREVETKDGLLVRLDRSLLESKSRERLHAALRVNGVPTAQ